MKDVGVGETPPVRVNWGEGVKKRPVGEGDPDLARKEGERRLGEYEESLTESDFSTPEEKKTT